MGVKYLSEEWAKEVNSAVQSNEDALNAAKGQNVSVQNVITDAPDGSEIKTYLKITDGAPELGLGHVDGPDLTVTSTYETQVALNKGELNGQQAFMQGKLKIDNVMKALSLQGFLTALGKAADGIDVEY